MGLLQALIIGIVQVLTEFLPLSSTAHPRIAPALLGWEDPGAAFSAVIQLGTLLAVLVYFRSDIARALRGWAKGFRGGSAAKTPEARLGWAIFYGTMPVSAAALLFKPLIEDEFRSLYVIAAALGGMALLLWVSELAAAHVRRLDSVRPLDGWIVGVFQALALVPGASRSGSTITGALFMGFDRPTAARFSFLLSVPAILISGLYELWDQRAELFAAGPGAVLVGATAAFFVGYASIEFLLRYLRTHSTAVFIVYRIALAALLLWLLWAGVLKPLG